MQIKQHIDFVLDAEKCLWLLAQAAKDRKNALGLSLIIDEGGDFKLVATPVRVEASGEVPNSRDFVTLRVCCPVPPGCPEDTKCKANYDEQVVVLENFEQINANQIAERNNVILFAW